MNCFHQNPNLKVRDWLKFLWLVHYIVLNSNFLSLPKYFSFSLFPSSSLSFCLYVLVLYIKFYFLFSFLPYTERKLRSCSEALASGCWRATDTSFWWRKTSLSSSRASGLSAHQDNLSSMSSVRKRLCSGFSMFSDAEIEEGIEEVGDSEGTFSKALGLVPAFFCSPLC